MLASRCRPPRLIDMASKKRRRRASLDAPEPLEDVLDRAGENRFAKRQLPIPLARWRALVGPRIADRTRPIALERGVLVVKVATSVWANELSLLAPHILEKLKTSGIAASSLRFRVGPLDVVEGMREERRFRRVPPPAPLAPEIERSLATIEDDELRGLIASAARSNLAWNVSEAPPAAPGLRAAGKGTAPPDRTEAGSDAASRRTRGGDSGRRR
jgi:hypothetical protein